MNVSPRNNGVVTEGVILAAGLSSRMGTFKPALLVNGKALICHCVERMLTACIRIFVVTGHSADIVQHLLQEYESVEMVHNPEFHRGMFTSVKAGVSRITTPHFFLTPGDIPTVLPSTFTELARTAGDVAIPVYHGRRGHPVWLSAAVRDKILAEPDTSTLRDVLHREDVVLVSVDDKGILVDIDTPDDYNEFKEHV